MIEYNPEIKEISKEELLEKINILELLGCTQSQIINIITSNSFYLSKLKEDIIKLTNYLKQKGFSCLNILFDSNPYILNLEPFEIDNYINNRLNNGETL